MGREGDRQLSFSLGLWRSRVIFYLNLSFHCKTPYFRFPTAKLIVDVWTFFDHFTPSILFAYSRSEHSQNNVFGGNNTSAPIGKADLICIFAERIFEQLRFCGFFGGSSDITYSKSQLDASVYWRSHSSEEKIVPALPIRPDIEADFT